MKRETGENTTRVPPSYSPIRRLVEQLRHWQTFVEEDPNIAFRFGKGLIVCKAARIVVAVFKGKSGCRILTPIDPLTYQRGFTESRRSRQQSQTAMDPSLEKHNKMGPMYQPRAKRRNEKLYLRYGR